MSDPVELINHLMLFATLLTLLALIVFFSAGKLYPGDEKSKNGFILISFLVVLFKIIYVGLFFAFLFPGWVINDDAGEYFRNITAIANDPTHLAAFDPKKLGMQYLYGLVMFCYQTNSIYAILGLNVFFSYLTCLVVLLLTRRLSDHPAPQLAALALSSIYPELLFWNGRVLRENISILLVPLLTYAFIGFYERPNFRKFLLVLATTAALFVVRAQLVLFVPLIILYYTLSMARSHPFRTALLTASLAGIIYAALITMFDRFFWFLDTIIFKYFDYGSMAFNKKIFMEALAANFTKVASVAATGRVGKLGLLLAPFVITAGTFFALSILNARQIFGRNRRAFFLLIFLIFSFLLMLAVTGFFNIRFRSNVAGLIIPIVCVGLHYYWPRLKFPTVRLLPRKEGADA